MTDKLNGIQVKTVRTSNPAHFDSEIAKLLNEGWEQEGETYIHGDILCQQMTLESDDYNDADGPSFSDIIGIILIFVLSLAGGLAIIGFITGNIKLDS